MRELRTGAPPGASKGLLSTFSVFFVDPRGVTSVIMVGRGLSSREAQETLHNQLEHLCRQLGRVDWLRELKQPPYTPLVCIGLALAGIVLVLEFSLAPKPVGSTLLHGVILLLLSVFNTVLFGWEVYIIKSRRTRRLLSRIKPFLDSTCPWTAGSYPSQSINTLRGHFTVHAYRDGRLVNLPCNLIVQGDLIELYRDIPSPANATYFDPKGMGEKTVIVERGSFPPPELFMERRWKKKEEEGGREEGIREVGQEKRVKFIVTQTPVIASYRITLTKRRATSVLTRQKTYAILALNVLALITLGVSFLLNVIRFAVLADDVGHWTEMLLGVQVYTVLPLLLPLFPAMWTYMNLYGTARVVILTGKDSNRRKTAGMLRSRVHSIVEVLSKILVLLLRPSMYPNYRVFHILGSLTSLCSVDKEYVLTDSAPVPEKVFFLTRRSLEDIEPKAEPKTEVTVDIPAEEEVKISGTDKVSYQKHTRFQGKLETCVEVHLEPVPGTNIVLGGEDGQKGITKSAELLKEENQPKLSLMMQRAGSDSAIIYSTPPSTTAIHEELFPLPADPTVSTSDNQQQPPNPKKMPSRFLSQESGTTLSERSGSQISKVPVNEDSLQTYRLSQAFSSSAMSIASHFELVGETLDLSPDVSHPSGLGFDDMNWEIFLSSLKPIGVNCLATSHFLRDPHSWSPGRCSEFVRCNLSKTNCICPLGIEIGVSEYLQTNFTEVALLFAVSERDENVVSFMRKPPATLLTEDIIQPHLLSSVLLDKVSGNYLIMSRGSGDMVAACCSDFWDGKDLQPMTNIERGEIEVFFARRHLTSYCVTLSYNPLVDYDLSSLVKKRIGIYVPKERLQSNDNPNTPVLGEGNNDKSVESFSGEQYYSNLLCNQVFLGVVSLQFQPKADIVELIEDLESTGIRFVYFTNENELRGRIFAEKLGLEAGWNCHISLAPGSEDEQTTSPDSNNEEDYNSQSSSTSSSLNSVINAFQSYVRAKLPKGVHNIRPHLKHVDNVPLLVPLFTDCTTDSIREMIQIMQENGEVVMCLGNAWNHDNLTIFAQSDVCLSIIPESPSPHCCLDSGRYDGTLSTSVSDNNFGNPPAQLNPKSPIWPMPLEMASYLNTAICQLCVHRQHNIRILDSLTDSRHIVSCIRHGLLFGMGSTVSLSALMVFATLLFLPPPLSGGHIFLFLLFSIPLVALSFLSAPLDPTVTTQMPSRKKKVLNEKLLGIVHFCVTFLPSMVLCLLLFALTLSNICSTSKNSNNSNCHPLLGDRNESSAWNGWRGTNEQGLLLAQDVTALFTSLHLVAHSIRFIHRTDSLWRLYRHASFIYVASVSLVVIVQIIYFAVSQILARDTSSTASYGIGGVPVYVWILGIASCFPLVLFHELLKWQDRKLVVKLQRHLKLEFETKLGMNSPF